MSSSEPPDQAGESSPGEAPLGAGIDFTDPNSPLSPYYLRASHVVAVTLLGAITVLFSLFPLWYTDVWGHLAFGRWMAEHGELPSHEPFCPFADKKTEYVNFQWLSQALFYQIYHAGELLAGGDAPRSTEGGVALLRTLAVLLGLGYYTLLLVAVTRRTGSLALGCAGIILMLVVQLGALSVLRPQAFAQLLFAALLVFLARPPLSWRTSLLILPPLFVLWGNLHGSFIVGLFLLGILLLGRVIEVSWAADESAPLFRDEQARLLLAAMLLSALAIALLNPHGPRLYLLVLQLSSNLNIATMNEWQPLLQSRGAGPIIGYSLSAVAVLATLAVTRRLPSPTDFLLLVTFGLFPIWQRRMMVWWTPLVPWILMRHWAAWAGATRPRWFSFQSVLSFRKTLMAIAVVFAAAAFLPPVSWLVRGKPAPLSVSVSSATPWQLAAQLIASPDAPLTWSEPLAEGLAKNYPNGRYQGAIFTSETVGDYLLWSLPEEWPVIMYTHVHLFTFRHWSDCLVILYGDPKWKEFLDRHGVNLVVVEAELYPRFCDHLRKDADWLTVVDETKSSAKSLRDARLFVALRKKPLEPRER